MGGEGCTCGTMDAENDEEGRVAAVVGRVRLPVEERLIGLRVRVRGGGRGLCGPECTGVGREGEGVSERDPGPVGEGE